MHLPNLHIADIWDKMAVQDGGSNYPNNFGITGWK
jgi:hypothetical protein